MSTWRFADLASRIEHDPYRSCMRTDVFYDGTFPTGISDGWVTASVYRQMHESTRGWSGVPASYVMGQDEALQALATNRNRASILMTLGAADSWRTLTREQLAAIAGSEVLAQSYPEALSAAFSAGLLAHGYVSAGANRLAPKKKRMSMWAVGDNRRAFEKYEGTLTFAERLAIAGGTPWTMEHRFDRHNVLATELALRVAEHCDVAAVLGEKHCSLSAILASTGVRVEKADDQRRADLGIVRNDGLIILVEVTASSGPTFKRKMERWAQLLQRHPTYDLPVALLVLDISTPQQQMVDAERAARTHIRKTILEAVRAYPGSATNRVASRIGYASWNEWFPARHCADDSFLELTARFATEDDPRDHWSTAALLDEIDMPFRDGSTERAETITANARLLAGTPYWMRTGERPDLGAYFLDRVAATGAVDSLPEREDVLVPDRMAGPPFAATFGRRRKSGARAG